MEMVDVVGLNVKSNICYAMIEFSIQDVKVLEGRVRFGWN